MRIHATKFVFIRETRQIVLCVRIKVGPMFQMTITFEVFIYWMR